MMNNPEYLKHLWRRVFEISDEIFYLKISKSVTSSSNDCIQ